jgi:CubicO group peptidase (beta-lactamase class C family)
MKKFIQSLIVNFLLLGFLNAQNIQKLDGSIITKYQVDNIVQNLIDSANVHGVGIGILNKGKVVYVNSYGYKNKVLKEKLDTNTIMYAASFSKSVFAYLMMKLIDENIISLDKPLSKYLKKPISEYEYFADLATDKRWKQITTRMCLSHTTGLPNVRWIHPKTGEQDSLGILKIYFQPGSKYAYSGEGLKLLQLVVEEITGKNVEELAQTKIFKPLGMNHTGYIWYQHFDTNYAIGHLEDGRLNPKAKRVKPVAGASMVTTLPDYSKFISYLLNQKGLSKKYYKEMFSKQIPIYSKTQFPTIQDELTDENKTIDLSYGLGWGLLKSKYGKAFFKEGHDDAWRNYNINFIDKGIGLIIMTNSANGEQIFKDLLERIIGDTFTPWKWENYYPYNYKK